MELSRKKNLPALFEQKTGDRRGQKAPGGGGSEKTREEVKLLQKLVFTCPFVLGI